MHIFNIIKDHGFSNDLCFLCGEKLTDQNRSNEHVFPKWLQNEFSLWDEKIVLLNGTDIPYRDLTIPCCAPCNSGPLSEIESKMKHAYSEGHESLINLDERDLFLWLGKIFFGLIYKELFLLADRKNAALGSIFRKEDMEMYAY